MGGSSALKEEDFGELEFCGILSSCCMSPMIFITKLGYKKFSREFSVNCKASLDFRFCFVRLVKNLKNYVEKKLPIPIA